MPKEKNENKDSNKVKQLRDTDLDQVAGGAGFQDRAYVAGRFALTIDGQVGDVAPEDAGELVDKEF